MAELIAIFRTKDVEEEIHDEKHSDDENEKSTKAHCLTSL